MSKGKFKFTGKTFWQILFFIIAISLTITFIPREEQFKHHYDEGKPWRYGLFTAPFDFPIYKSEKEVAEEIEEAKRNFTPFYFIDTDIEKNEIADFKANNRSLDADTAFIYHKIEALLKNVYSKGIIDRDTYDELKSEGKKKIKILNNSIATECDLDNILTPLLAYEQIKKSIYAEKWEQYFYDIDVIDLFSSKNLGLYIEPNLIYDKEINSKTLAQISNDIQPTVGMVQKGERIIDRGVIVSHDIYRILKSYEKKASKDKVDKEDIYSFAGQVLIVLILYSFLYLYLGLFRRRIFNNIRQLSLLMLMILAITLASFALSQRWVLGIYMAPFAVLPIVIVTFMDTRTALYASLVAIFLSCWASPFPMEYVLLQLIVSMTAINSLKELTKRSQMFRSVVLIFIAYCVTYAAYLFMNGGDITKLNKMMFVFLGINCFMLLFSYLFIYIIEKVWGFTSNVMLVELGDLNSPLLKELSEKCPGTFQHATQVANLAAEAANAIGANALLVRTGALYHDIGKSVNPMFFTENQHGVNPHSKLSYKESARIIISHVKDGLNLAKSYHIPESIKGFIATHHGVSKAKYFYTMYKNEHPDEVIDEKLFSYEGPKPRTKEEGILMIADIIEAKSRSLKDFSAENLSKIVNSTIDDIIAEKGLSETPLTFRDVTEIRKVLIKRLEAIYHPRISYPEGKKE